MYYNKEDDFLKIFMPPLTNRERQLLDWLIDQFQKLNYMPPISKMIIGISSYSKEIQDLRKQLRQKGYITWVDGKSGTLRLCHDLERYPRTEADRSQRGIPLLGTIAAGAVVESFTDAPSEYIEVLSCFNTPEHYVLRVIGDSMINAGILDNDRVVLRRHPDRWSLKPQGAIVAAYVEGEGTTLKYFEPAGDRIRLIPANPAFQPIEREAARVQIQGVVVHLHRDYA